MIQKKIEQLQMKRHIATPAKMFTGDAPPKEAVELAKVFHLEIKKVEDGETIEIVAEPEIQSFSYSNTYADGMIWILDITDEYTTYYGDCFIVIDGEIYRPQIRESHSLRFRPRLYGFGKKHFSVFVNDKIVLEGEIENHAR